MNTKQITEEDITEIKEYGKKLFWVRLNYSTNGIVLGLQTQYDRDCGDSNWTRHFNTKQEALDFISIVNSSPKRQDKHTIIYSFIDTPFEDLNQHLKLEGQYNGSHKYNSINFYE